MLFRSILAQTVSSSFWVHCENIPKRWNYESCLLRKYQWLSAWRQVPVFPFFALSLKWFAMFVSAPLPFCLFLDYHPLPHLPCQEIKARGKFFLQQKAETEFRRAQKSCECLESYLMSYSFCFVPDGKNCFPTDNLPWHKSFFWNKTLKPKKCILNLLVQKCWYSECISISNFSTVS